MKDCIFCKIVSKEVKANIVFESDNLLCILDAYPEEVGHCLILTKNHKENIFELEDSQAELILPLAKKVALAIKNSMHAEGINIIQNNGALAKQVIMHYHLHIVPRYEQPPIEQSREQIAKLLQEEIDAQTESD